MLLLAALLIVMVTIMHSVIGELRLIQPVLKMEGLPVILGSLQNTRTTIRVAWHITSLFWLGLAFLLLHLHRSGENAEGLFLIVLSVMFGISGVLALILSRGAHLSWVFFLPIALLTGLAAMQS